jgi:hypothetical protein
MAIGHVLYKDGPIIRSVKKIYAKFRESPGNWICAQYSQREFRRSARNVVFYFLIKDGNGLCMLALLIYTVKLPPRPPPNPPPPQPSSFHQLTHTQSHIWIMLASFLTE